MIRAKKKPATQMAQSKITAAAATATTVAVHTTNKKIKQKPQLRLEHTTKPNKIKNKIQRDIIVCDRHCWVIER